MLTEKRKILVIENQELQFNGIIGCLVDYTYFPEKTSYINFVDHVRVWVNQLYNSSYRESGIVFITNYIKSNKIELIIMDHILGGAHHCLTGIDLAKEINQRRIKENLDVIPIAFLSKTVHNDAKRLVDYDGYKQRFYHSESIHKGYFGDEILKVDYFNSRVIPTIETLLGKNLVRQVIEILNNRKPILDATTNKEGNPDRELHFIISKVINKIEENMILVDANFKAIIPSFTYQDFSNLLNNINNE